MLHNQPKHVTIITRSWQMNPVTALSTYTCKNGCNIFLPSTLRFSFWSFAFTFPNPTLLHNLPPQLCTTGFTQLIIYDIIIISHEVQKLRRLSLCSYLLRILLPLLLAILFKAHSDFFLGKEGNPSCTWKNHNKTCVDRMTFGSVSSKQLGLWQTLYFSLLSFFPILCLGNHNRFL